MTPNQTFSNAMNSAKVCQSEGDHRAAMLFAMDAIKAAKQADYSSHAGRLAKELYVECWKHVEAPKA